ncbi:chalcone-flavanone isomerase-domain-containing protein [Lactarius hengduanensis]|nr:chalcone-flavanone isomerase-domain-containing protein [Lactarius hengduanensis]
MLRRVLVSAVPRQSRSYYPHVANPPKLRPSCLTFLGLGAALALSVSVGIAHLDSNDFSNKEATVVDPATSIEFPAVLRIPSKGTLPPFTLIGVGVRVVSFLKIKVYSVAFYADLSNPNLKIPPSASPEEKVQYIVRNTACVLRIGELPYCFDQLNRPIMRTVVQVPTRNTSYTHLRDAFVRTLQMRQRLAHQAGDLSSDEQLALQAPISQLKTVFPNAPFVKDTPLDIVLTPPDPKRPRALIIQDLGAIQNEWVAREFVLSYFDGQGNSPALKQSVFDRVAQL